MQEMQNIRVQSQGQDNPLEEERQLTLVSLSGKSHRQRSLVGYSPWDCRVGHDWETEHEHKRLWKAPTYSWESVSPHACGGLCAYSGKIWQVPKLLILADFKAPRKREVAAKAGLQVSWLSVDCVSKHTEILGEDWETFSFRFSRKFVQSLAKHQAK